MTNSFCGKFSFRTLYTIKEKKASALAYIIVPWANNSHFSQLSNTIHPPIVASLRAQVDVATFG